METNIAHTPGPWRWEFNAEHRSVHLVGGKPQFDLTVMDFTRWGMAGAGIRLRETSLQRLDLMHKLHERPDWIAPFAGRAHHKHWCAAVIHPDMRLIEAAPDLLEALRAFTTFAAQRRAELGELSPEMEAVNARASAAIAKATGGAA